jgi:cystathionine beta-lyase
VNGLVSFELDGANAKDMERMIDALELFGIGASWGGFESVVLPADVASSRTVTDWSGRGPIVRLHIGLEDPRDLIEDLERGFAAL